LLEQGDHLFDLVTGTGDHDVVGAIVRSGIHVTLAAASTVRTSGSPACAAPSSATPTARASPAKASPEPAAASSKSESAKAAKIPEPTPVLRVSALLVR